MVAWQHHLSGDSAEEGGAGPAELGRDVLRNLGQHEADGQDPTIWSPPHPRLQTLEQRSPPDGPWRSQRLVIAALEPEMGGAGSPHRSPRDNAAKNTQPRVSHQTLKLNNQRTNASCKQASLSSLHPQPRYGNCS